MALISQILAVSYDKSLNEARKPTNQWGENAFMREAERLKMIRRESLAPTLTVQLDYRRNPGAGFISTDLQQVSLTKTEVFTEAQFTPAQLTSPMVWSKYDEAVNPSENQKIAFVKNLILNGLETHDSLIEEAMFTTSTNGFLGFGTFMPSSGQGSCGGIDASVETMWRNPTGTYQTDGSDMDAAFTTVYNSISKGSGSASAPNVMVSGSTPHATFESTLTPQQRYIDTEEAKVGFKVLGFKTCRYSFSQYGGTSVYMFNSKHLYMVVSKEYFRQRGDTNEIDNANGYVTKVYSALQMVTDAKSRLGVLIPA